MLTLTTKWTGVCTALLLIAGCMEIPTKRVKPAQEPTGDGGDSGDGDASTAADAGDGDGDLDAGEDGDGDVPGLDGSHPGLTDAGSDGSMSLVDACVDASCASECQQSSDCRDLNRPLCDNLSCVACTEEFCSTKVDSPVCSSAGACVECSDGDDSKCQSNLDENKVCKEGGTTCVECNADDDCKDAGAAKCDLGTNRCVKCDDGKQCDHIMVGDDDDLDVCNAGTCVQCTPATESDQCGDNACDPDTLTCTGTKRGSVAACHECRSDSECGLHLKCIQVPFQSKIIGWFCMPEQTSGCKNPYQGPAIAAESKNGLPSAHYCAHNTKVASCDAIVSLTSNKACDGATVQTDCGDGARCESVNGSDNRCTYACASDAVCPDDFLCSEENGAQLVHYCGGPSQ